MEHYLYFRSGKSIPDEMLPISINSYTSDLKDWNLILLVSYYIIYDDVKDNCNNTVIVSPDQKTKVGNI